MTKTKLSLLAATLMASSVAFASSHREAPAISNDPQADNTDLYAWVDPDLSTLHIVANWIPLEEPSGGPNFHKFSDDVLYQIHIAGNASGATGNLNDTITYNIRFTTAPITNVAGPYLSDGGLTSNVGGQEFFAQLAGSFSQTYVVSQTVGGVTTVLTPATAPTVAPPNIGPRTDAVVYQNFFGQATTGDNTVPGDGGYDDAFAATFLSSLTFPASGGTGAVWAGPRDDGFYVDLGGVFDLANLRAQGVAQDGVSGFNTHSVAMDIPVTAILGKAATAGASDAQTIGVWASSSRPKVNIYRNDGTHAGVGPWVQVSRLGLPLINEAVIGLQDKDKYNRTTPVTDVANFANYFLSPPIVSDAVAVNDISAAQGISATTLHGGGDIIDIISLVNQPTTGAHTLQTNLSNVGDVLRVDLGIAPAFPDGRAINSAKAAGVNTEDAPVTDVLLSVLLVDAPSGVSQGVTHNDKTFLQGIPWLALPWQGWAQGHGKPTP
jgi:hypothetical protein